MRVVEWAGRANHVAVTARSSQLATEIALPAQEPGAPVRERLPPCANPAVLPPRVHDDAVRRLVVVNLTSPHAHENAARSVARRNFQVAVPLRDAGAAGAGKSNAEGRRVDGATRPRGDHAAEGVR